MMQMKYKLTNYVLLFSVPHQGSGELTGGSREYRCHSRAPLLWKYRLDSSGRKAHGTATTIMDEGSK
jgi:hypothetical protein